MALLSLAEPSQAQAAGASRPRAVTLRRVGRARRSFAAHGQLAIRDWPHQPPLGVQPWAQFQADLLLPIATVLALACASLASQAAESCAAAVKATAQRLAANPLLTPLIGVGDATGNRHLFRLATRCRR